MTIRTRLALLVVSVVSVPVGVVGLLSYIDSRSLSDREEARFAAFHAVHTWLAGEVAPRWAQVRTLEPPDGHRALVVDSGRAVLVSSVVGVAAGDRVDRGTLAARFPPPEHRILELPIFVEGALVGAAFEVQSRTSPWWLRWRWLLDSGRYGLATLIVIGVAMVWWLAHVLRRSLGDLERASERIAAGDLNFRLNVEGRDEVAAVARSFDHMRRSLIEERRMLRAERERKRSFLMAVSHDLRTPLTSIKGYLEALQDGMAPDRGAELRYLRIARDRVDLLATRIADLNELLRMETGEWRMQRERRNLTEMLGALAVDYREDALLIGRRFQAAIDLPDNLVVDADWSLFTRVTDNLMENALQYTRSGDRIRLAALQYNGQVEVTVQDSGPGIPADQLAHIFDPFFRGAAERPEPGSGLGLAVARSIVEAHGWQINAAAGNGGGASFTIVIPNRTDSERSAMRVRPGRAEVPNAAG